MNIPVFQLVNYLLIIVVLIILIRYTWDMLFDRDYQPAAWQQLKRKGKISKELLKEERNFPDKVRFFTWWFQVERINHEQVPGSFAELGVYKGESARVLRKMDKQRKFHLFDTFTGFVKEELKHETGVAATYSSEDFADTSVGKVLENIGNDENLYIHPGIFPETTSGLESEQFALVNIDADLYLPTIEGLSFFYPRLSPGGVILIHDYNYKWEGVMKAVNEFSARINEPLIHIPDMEGTIMIIKAK